MCGPATNYAIPSLRRGGGRLMYVKHIRRQVVSWRHHSAVTSRILRGIGTSMHVILVATSLREAKGRSLWRIREKERNPPPLFSDPDTPNHCMWTIMRLRGCLLRLWEGVCIDKLRLLVLSSYRIYGRDLVWCRSGAVRYQSSGIQVVSV